MPTGFSDHSLVVCHVLIRDFKPKSTHWHFNSGLTLDGKFKDVLGYFWAVFRQKKGDFSSLRQWWDHGKTQIQSVYEGLGVELEKMSASSGERGYIEILKEKKLTLANLLDTKVQGYL